MAISLIHVPYMIGNEHHAVSTVSARFMQAGALALLAAQGVEVTVTRVERDVPFRDSTQASAAVNRQIAAAVRAALGAGRLPLVLGSSCEVSMGVLAGFEHTRCGVVWLDAHGDFNTPDTTLSGVFPGMALSVVSGACYGNLWGQIGDHTPIAEQNVLLLGVRDLDPAEKDRLDRSAVRMVRWRDGEPERDILAALDALAAQTGEIYLHIDHNSYNSVAVPGGLSMADMETIIRAVAERFQVKAVTLTAFNPDDDPDGSALRAGLRVIELLGICDRAR